MLKKLTLSLLLCSAFAQPLMAASIDTVALKACQGALQGTQPVDMQAFINCLEKCKDVNSGQFTRSVEWVSENPMLTAGIITSVGALLFYTLIWPDVAIRVSYQKNSRAEMQAAGRRP